MIPRSIFRLLLRLYPTAFRERYGPAMADTFADLFEQSKRTSPRFWTFVVMDMVRGAWIQHVDRWSLNDRRVAVRWLLLCIAGTVLCHGVGTALTWGFAYFYHPYLDGTVFVPSIYGALLGIALGTTQSLMFSAFSERVTWIFLSAASSAIGLEIAQRIAPLTGPVGFGVVVGSTVASAQWLALRGRMRRPSAAAFASAIAVAATVVAGSVALSQATAGFNPLPVEVVASAIKVEALFSGLYPPMSWSECLVAMAFTAIPGFILGMITLKPASSWLAGAH